MKKLKHIPRYVIYFVLANFAILFALALLVTVICIGLSN